jgi:hypothetical protein
MAVTTSTTGAILFFVGGLVVGAAFALLAQRIRVRVWRFFARRRKRSLPRPSEPQVAPDFEQRPSLKPTLENLARQPLLGPRFYVSDVAVQSFRCFDSAAVDLRHPGESSRVELKNVNLILGDNGSGKSTLLKAIAIAALAPVLDSSGFVPYHLVRKGCDNASLVGRFVSDDRDYGPTVLEGRAEIEAVRDYEKVSVPDNRSGWSRLFEELDPSFLVVGYGVNRRTAEDETDFRALSQARRRRRYQRVAGLFEQSAVLTPLSSWLPSANFRRRTEALELLELVVPADTRIEGAAEPEPVFVHRGLDVPYRALSDGYKSFIGWVSDLLFQIDSVTGGDLPYTEVGGIVLVDEVDLLLHPIWQRDVVPNVARALPNLQFVFTSHSPIVAGTLEADNILIAGEPAEGESRLRRVDAPIHGLDSEQILLSSYFELHSTRARDAQARLDELATQAMEGDDEAAVAYLRALSRDPRNEA